MENKQLPSLKKSLLNKEEKIIRNIDYENSSVAKISDDSPKSHLYLDVEIIQDSPFDQEPTQKVLVSIKPRAPGIKTLYLAEKDRFSTKKRSHKTGSRLAIGDHLSFPTRCGTDKCQIDNSNTTEDFKSDILINKDSFSQAYLTEDISDNSSTVSKCLNSDNLSEKDCKLYYRKNRSTEKCYVYAQPQLIMNLPKVNETAEVQVKNGKTDAATATKSNSDDTLISGRIVKKLIRKINNLERKLLIQEMVLRSIENNVPTSSSDEECKGHVRTSLNSHPGCSYIEQYSHVPETSAFQRYAQQSTSVSASKATHMGKDLKEQYGRDFTTYDGITARGRRQSSSVPGKRDDIPKIAAERVHKIRHKLNPVRDYRLMDTVHYLAQGEFAPRDDGIKLTPSREAVLSDIIWEDVCRTHWPNARLARRQCERTSDRYSSRFELQRLIDNLLRERVAHVERRRRRHYRIVKLNHRHESCRPVGKTGDIIVASHKSKQSNEDGEIPVMNKNVASAVLTNHKHEDHNARRTYRSHDRLTYPWLRKKKCRQDDSSPGPSSAVYHSTSKSPTYCYQASNAIKINCAGTPEKIAKDTTSTSNSSDTKNMKPPRLLAKKDSLRRKFSARSKPNLEHYILLPTLVVRTPSNVKRQKKFNELYHRVLNGHLNNEQNSAAASEYSRNRRPNPSRRDIGLNINITVTDSEENLSRKLS
ncbi:PREDICTED: uncharacterized protein LOC106115538 [Papilio xuthus]|uniref:Uncharacterized protein LOC106115538 n=1 Tax=Papilio xuthus TaxID=66420 RepID=A0AAJ6Z2Y2_PAPXU|nr:PREDICTED: uncharacterized protein LOC106115538 [Papilio xuthus]